MKIAEVDDFGDEIKFAESNDQKKAEDCPKRLVFGYLIVKVKVRTTTLFPF